MAFVDYYELLQISPSAETEIINAAYKRLAIKYHPDSGGANKSEDKMKLLNEARDTLNNSRQRANYDSLWKQENEKKQRVKAAKFLLDQKKYDEAKTILIGVDHPTAQKWLEQIDRLLAKESTSKQRPSSTQSKPTTYPPPNIPPPPPSKPDIGDMAELRIGEIRRRDAERASARHRKELEQLQREHERQEEIREREEYEQVIIRTYQKIGRYAFQWEGSESQDINYILGNSKIRAWNSILKQRYEEARKHIKAASRTDQNMLDWLTIINHIFQQETVFQKFARLGFNGFLSYQFWDGFGMAFATWTIYFLVAILIVFSIFTVTGSLVFAAIYIPIACGFLTLCLAIMRIILDR